MTQYFMESVSFCLAFTYIDQSDMHLIYFCYFCLNVIKEIPHTSVYF